MKSILEELWYGNICPETDKRSNSEDMKQLMKYMFSYEEKIEHCLSSSSMSLVSTDSLLLFFHRLTLLH